jgi:hypothetical protein
MLSSTVTCRRSAGGSIEKNEHMHRIFGRLAARSFFAWLDLQGLAELNEIRTHHVPTYTELLTRTYSAPTVKQHLAATRRGSCSTASRL